MGSLIQDLRYGLRVLRKNPGLPALAVLTLALGIAANSTIFSWINSTLLNPIPGVARTSDMVTVMRGERSDHPTPPFSYPDYRDLRDNNGSFSGLLAYHHEYVSLTGEGKPERIYGVLTSANYFDVLGVGPILGRGFVPAEERGGEGSAPVAVISYELWQSHFGSDPSIIDRKIQINRYPYTVVGVAPPGFQGCMPGLRGDIWIPAVMVRAVWGFEGKLDDRGDFWLNVLGRLRPGINSRQAEGELNLLMQRIAERFPDDHQGPNQISLDPLWRSPFGANVYLSATLPMLLGLAALLLLLACANVANLLLVRSISRRREIAIRLSIGASRWRLVRQLMMESLLLGLAGGALAVFITTWSAGTFTAFVPSTTLPLALNGHADHTVVLVTLAISIVTAVIFGILPALRSSNLAPVTVLKEEAGSVSGGLHRSRLASALVVMQIALSVLLLVCAGLFTRSLEKAQRSDPGFDPDHVLLESFELRPSGYSSVRGLEFDRQLLAKIEALPGVESVTLADFSPLSYTIRSEGVQLEGYVPRPHESMEIDWARVGPNYFRTLRTPLVSGRDFTAQDDAKSQSIAIVNEEFVARYWPGQDAIGKRIRLYDRWRTVVGVARNAKYRRVTYNAEPCFFVPWFQDYPPFDAIIVHTRVSGEPMAFAAPVERAIHELNPDLPVFNVDSLRSSMQMGSLFERIVVTFAGSFGLLALALAAVGVYGVVAYATRQRTHEIGIRMALGAEPADVLRLVLGHGLRMTLTGLGVGVAVSLAVTRLLRTQLLGVAPTDVLTYASVALLLSVVALAACYIPARRATKVQPTVALRCE
ncbi:MAG TPA: ABC transporter permease [Terriglobia bacterium]|nr:ABC transporter permease [Terriglobia bacterium]